MKDRRAQEKEVTEAREHLADLAPTIEDRPSIDINFLRRLEAHKEDARLTLLRAKSRLKDLQAEEQQTRNDLLQKRSAEEALQTLHDREKGHHLRKLENAENKRIEEQALENYRRHQLRNKYE